MPSFRSDAQRGFKSGFQAVPLADRLGEAIGRPDLQEPGPRGVESPDRISFVAFAAAGFISGCLGGATTTTLNVAFGIDPCPSSPGGLVAHVHTGGLLGGLGGGLGGLAGYYRAGIHSAVAGEIGQQVGTAAGGIGVNDMVGYFEVLTPGPSAIP